VTAVATEPITGVSGSRWALLGGTLTLRRADGTIYLKRWRLIQTPWFGVFLHRIGGPDPGVDLHDHPWSFRSVILRGGYTQVTAPRHLACRWAAVEPGSPGWRLHYGAGQVNRMSLSMAHAIVAVDRTPTWSLVLTGRRQRVWGFHTPDGWVDWRDYDHNRRDGLHAEQTRRVRQGGQP